MRRQRWFCALSVLLLGLGWGFGLCVAPPAFAHEHGGNGSSLRPRASSAALFIENVGQFDDGLRFLVRGASDTLSLADDGLLLSIAPPFSPASVSPSAPPLSTSTVKLRFVGASPHVRLVPFDRTPTVISFLRGQNPAAWHIGVPAWRGVRYVDLYPGIDLELSASAGSLAPRLVVHAGADASLVRLRLEGATNVSLVDNQLVLTTAAGTRALPLITSGVIGSAQIVANDDGTLDVVNPFGVAATRVARAPTASPSQLVYATFLGGTIVDTATSVAVDAQGAAYVTGWTSSVDFPRTPGSRPFTEPSIVCGSVACPDAFVAKLDPTGSYLEYATYIGGSQADRGLSIAVDAQGAAYVAGYTSSPDFPTTPGAYDRSVTGSDSFVVKLAPNGTALTYGTVLGGSNSELGTGLAVDDSGAAYLTGYTGSADFPLTENAYRSPTRGQLDAFVAKFTPKGNKLAYSVVLGGSEDDLAYGIAVDSQGAAYITGTTSSPAFPATAGAFDTTLDTSYPDGIPTDAFVVKLQPNGRKLAYATFIGGELAETGKAIAVDHGGRAYITGNTNSLNFPSTAGSFDTSFNSFDTSSSDGFVVKLNARGNALVYSGYLGGSYEEAGNAIAVDSDGRAIIAGFTISPDFPTTSNGLDLVFNTSGDTDAFVVRLAPDGSTLNYGTFLGGEDPNSSTDAANGIAVGRAGAFYVVGYTSSPDFPTTPNAWDTVYDGEQGDAFVAKLHLP